MRMPKTHAHEGEMPGMGGMHPSEGTIRRPMGTDAPMYGSHGAYDESFHRVSKAHSSLLPATSVSGEDR